MGFLKKKVIAISLVTALMTPAVADMGSFVEDNLDGSFQVTNGGYFKTQTGGYYSLGSVRIRWDGGGTVYPLHIQAPKFNVGCNGIDLMWGGFSYLNFEYLVEKLKKIAAVAPAFAFQMAMRTMCPQCATILDNLEKIANMINSLNLDSCKAAQYLGNKMGKMMSNAVTGGSTDNWLNARAESINNGLNTVTDFLSGVRDRFGSDEGAKDMLGWGSAVEKAMETYSPAGFDRDEFEALMVAVVGDIYGYVDVATASDGSDQSRVNQVSYKLPAATPKQILDLLTKGGELEVEIFKKQTTSIDGKEVYTAPDRENITLNITEDKTLPKLIGKKIKSIITHIKNKEALTDSDIDFINSMPFPIYRIANLATRINDDNFINNVSIYLGYLEAQELIRFYAKQVKSTFNSYLASKKFKNLDANDKKTFFKNINDNLSTVNSQLDKNMQLYINKLNTQVNFTNYFQKIEKELMQNSTIWRANGL